MYYVHICIYTCDFHAYGWFSYCDELQLRSVQTQQKLDINTRDKKQYGQTKDNLRRVTRMLHGCMLQLLIGQKKERKKVRMHSENYFFASCSKEKKRRENKEREKRKREKKKCAWQICRKTILTRLEIASIYYFLSASFGFSWQRLQKNGKKKKRKRKYGQMKYSINPLLQKWNQTKFYGPLLCGWFTYWDRFTWTLSILTHDAEESSVL